MRTAALVLAAGTLALAAAAPAAAVLQSAARPPARLLLHLRGGLLSEDQMRFTAERLSCLSKGEIQHIFADVDKDGSGRLSYDELDFLAPYFGASWDDDFKKKVFAEMDTSGNGLIDAIEFYDWLVHNVKDEGIGADGKRTLTKREQRIQLGLDEIPKHLTALLDELGTGAIVQKVTHPLHSAFGRTLRDHFVSSYLLAQQWGNPKDVVQAALFHALYQRGDGLQAVKAADMRPSLQERLGQDVEELMYLFPSAHKSAYEPNGILHAPLGKDVTVNNVLEPGTCLTINPTQRAKLCEIEVINSHDQHVLENINPVHNLWCFYQHATILPLLSKPARETIEDFKRLAHGATCADVHAWHTKRFSGKETPEVWKRHIQMFAPNGRYTKVEKELHRLADFDGDNQIDWKEFVTFMSIKFPAMDEDADDAD